ncbi:MAG TPA: hypothetical protein VM901_12640 [Bdellovibrionota bacterium]|nr:hypothetical protein [Bdellovibrionota bacterium]
MKRLFMASYTLLYTFSALFAYATPPQNQPAFIGARRSDSLTEVLAREGVLSARNTHDCALHLSCKGFPIVSELQRINPEFFREYHAARNASDRELLSSPLVLDPAGTDETVQRTFETLGKQMQSNRFLRSGVRNLVSGGAAIATGGSSKIAGWAVSAVTGLSNKKLDEDEEYIDEKEEQVTREVIEADLRTIRERASNAQRKADLEDYEKARAKASPEQSAKLDQGAKGLAEALTGIATIQKDLAQKRLQKVRDEANAKPNGVSATQKWYASGKNNRMEFEIGRAVVPPDKFYELAVKGEINLPADLSLDELKAERDGYLKSQEYQQIQKHARDAYQIGTGMVAIASSLGLKPQTADGLNKALSISLSVVMAFCPPSPVNIALAVVGIVGTLLSRGGGNDTGKILNQIVQMQQEILTQIRMIRVEMHRNHAEVMDALSKVYATLQYESLNLRALVTDEIKRDVFGYCNGLETDFQEWTKHPNTPETFGPSTIETYLAGLSANERSDFVSCLKNLQTLLLGENPGHIHAFFVAGANVHRDQLTREQRESFVLSNQLRAQNYFDAILAYAHRYGFYKNLELATIAAPTRDYWELKRLRRSGYESPIDYSTDRLSDLNFRQLVVPASLESIFRKVIFLSMFSSNLDMNGDVVSEGSIRTQVSAKLPSGFNKNVYRELKILRDLLAVARTQQNLLNGGAWIPELWKNLNRGLAVYHYQRLQIPSAIGLLGSKNYEDTLAILEENPLLASNLISWGLWEGHHAPRDQRLERPVDLLSTYREAYAAERPEKLIAVFSGFESPAKDFDDEDRRLFDDKTPRNQVPTEALPKMVRGWEDPDVRIVCWQEEEYINELNRAYREKSQILNLDMADPVRDIRSNQYKDPVESPKEEARRANAIKVADLKIQELEAKKKTFDTCREPEQKDRHKWFVKFPRSGNFTALPLPEKVQNFELYLSQGAERINEMSERLELELYDYEWEYWEQKLEQR